LSNIKELVNRKIDIRLEGFCLLKDNVQIVQAVELASRVLRRGDKVLVCGNGGSATQASHFAAELVNKFYFARGALAAVSLNTDIANLTAIANDSDYRYVFSRQVEALGRNGDILVGLTTSGSSPNVLEAFKWAQRMGIATIALCGSRSQSLQELGLDIVIPVPSSDTPTIQEMHLFILHMMAECLELELFGHLSPGVSNQAGQGR